MGWWKIVDKSGGIDFRHKCPINPKLSNAIPGIDLSNELYNGDIPADIMGNALDHINQEYGKAWGRKATREELEAVFNFVMGGLFKCKE